MTTTSTGVIRVGNGVRSAHDTEKAEMSEREELLQDQKLIRTFHETVDGHHCSSTRGSVAHSQVDLEMFQRQSDHIPGLRMIRHVCLEKCADAFRPVETGRRHDRGNHSLVEQGMKGFEFRQMRQVPVPEMIDSVGICGC